MNNLPVQNDVIKHMEALEPPYAQHKASNFVKIAKQFENCITQAELKYLRTEIMEF